VLLSFHPIGLHGWQSAINYLSEHKQSLKQFYSFYAEMEKNIYYINLELQEQTK